MTVAQAFNILNLSPTVSKKTMVKRYRELIKNFHPDKVKNSIAGDRDAKILNHAYSLLLKYFDQHSTLSYDNQFDIDHHYQETDRESDVTDEKYSTTNDIDENPTEILIVPAHLKNHTERICSLICDFYSMRLANIPLRSSGSTRTFFSTFLHQYKKTLAILYAEQEDGYRIHQLSAFFSCFYDNAQLDFFLQPTKSREINKLNRAYIQSSSITDEAIAIRYCNNHSSLKQNQYISNKKLHDAYQVFELLSSLSHPSIFNEPARIKLMLIHSFVQSVRWTFAE